MSDQDQTVTQLISLLKGQAHLGFSDAVAEFPVDQINTKAPNVEYTFYALIEHINRTQQDILNYIDAPKYDEPKWPDDYWPAKDYQASQDDWQKTIRQVEEGISKLIEILSDQDSDLNAVVKHGSGDHTLLREILMVADHNAYHIGELAILRQVTDSWGSAKH